MGIPLLALVAGATLALVAARLRGWTGAAFAAAGGVILLVTGLSGDLISHAAQDARREEAMAAMAGRPGAAVIARLQELEADEAGNRWHLVAAAGEGLLVTGLTGACVLLWRRTRTGVPATAAGALARGAAWATTPEPAIPGRPVLMRRTALGAPVRLRREGARRYPLWMTEPTRSSSARK
jgi:hypothetical protein